MAQKLITYIVGLSYLKIIAFKKLIPYAYSFFCMSVYNNYGIMISFCSPPIELPSVSRISFGRRTAVHIIRKPRLPYSFMGPVWKLSFVCLFHSAIRLDLSSTHRMSAHKNAYITHTHWKKTVDIYITHTHTHTHTHIHTHTAIKTVDLLAPFPSAMSWLVTWPFKQLMFLVLHNKIKAWAVEGASISWHYVPHRMYAIQYCGGKA